MATRQKKNGRKAAKKRSGGLPERFCFVLMPFRAPFNTYYERIYVPAIRGADLEPRRIDEVFRAGTIIKDIWDYTVGAEVLVAELTGRNPNVFYELGLAHAIAKPVVLITQDLDDVPFDLKHLRHILYTTVEPDWAARLQQDLTRAIVETLEDPVASLALPSVSSYGLAGGKEVTEESEVVTLLKALDSKVDYMRRETSPTRVYAVPSELPSEFYDALTSRRPTFRDLLQRWLLHADEAQLLALYEALGKALRRDIHEPEGGDEPERKAPRDS